jgi:hypothetical protein
MVISRPPGITTSSDPWHHFCDRVRKTVRNAKGAPRIAPGPASIETAAKVMALFL